MGLVSYLSKCFSLSKKSAAVLSIPVTQRDVCDRQSAACQWQDSEEVYYILDTLKVNYRNSLGSVTLEDLSNDSLKSLLKGDIPLLGEPRSLNDSCITLSVCAMNWQMLGDKKRCKAIDSAASIRIYPQRGYRSQARFKSAEQVLDCRSDVLLQSTKKSDHQIVYNLSIKQFVEYLQRQNKSFAKSFETKSSIQAGNFKRVFSSFEESRLQALYALCVND